VAYPEEPLQRALERMLEHDIGRLPVVRPENPERIEGYLGRAAILSARMRDYQEEQVREPGLISELFKNGKRKERVPAPS